MRCVPRFGVPFVGILCLCANLTEAFAQGNAAAAEALFERGRADMAIGNFDRACDEFRQSDALDAAIGTKLNLADCESKRGRVATAWELFKALEQSLPPSEPRFSVAKQNREALEPALPKLVLVLAATAPRTTTVKDGDAVYGTAAFNVPLPLDPGPHKLTVLAPDRIEAEVLVNLEQGKTLSVEISPGPTRTAPLVPLPSTLNSSTPYAPASHSKSVDMSGPNWSAINALSLIGGASLVLSATSGVLAFRAKSINRDHCDEAARTCDETGREAAHSGRVYGAVTTVSLTASVVSLGLATYYYLRPSRKERTQSSITADVGGSKLQLIWVREW